MRLIDADALIYDINNGLWDWEQLKNITGITVLKQTISDIQNSPVIDAVPVVRCKDCKWFYESDTVICCEKHTGLALARKDDYCSHGERRNDD